MVLAAVLFAYAALLLPLFLRAHPVPDEQWFLREAADLGAGATRAGWFSWTLKLENRLGYGALYWLGHVLASHVSEAPLRPLRLLGWAYLVSIPLSIGRAAMRAGGGITTAAFATLLWLSFPAAWWTGKLTGPELPSLALAAAGLAQLSSVTSRRRGIGWALLGAAVGIKATAASLLPFACVISWRRAGACPRLVRAAAWLAAGIVVSNPIILSSPNVFVAWLRAAAGPNAAWRWPLDWTRLSGGVWTWDALPSLGAAQWSMGGLGLALWALVCAASSARLRALAATAATLGAGFTALMMAACIYGWYWFPTLLALPLAWAVAGSTPPGARRLAAGLLVVNVAANAGPIKQRYRHRMQQTAVLGERGAVRTCVAELLERAGPIAQVYDYSEHDLEIDWPRLLAAARREASVVPLREVSDFMAYRGPVTPLRGPALAIVGERLRAVQVPGLTAAAALRLIPGVERVEGLGRCAPSFSAHLLR